MRLTTTIDRLTAEQWTIAHQILRTEYEIPMDASRVCLVLEHRGEERHAELPLGAYAELLRSLAADSVLSPLRTAMAALTPDALPDHLEKVRQAADPERLPALPTPDEVRNLSAADAAKLAAKMNPVRRDCAFCHQERSAKDNNHADNCPYWIVGPGKSDA